MVNLRLLAGYAFTLLGLAMVLYVFAAGLYALALGRTTDSGLVILSIAGLSLVMAGDELL